VSLKKPTAGEYAVVGLVNVGVAFFLGLRENWSAAYFVALALGCFGAAIRARSRDSV
jgi:type IV secretory pathway VirB2 component (pilin)